MEPRDLEFRLSSPGLRDLAVTALVSSMIQATGMRACVHRNSSGFELPGLGFWLQVVSESVHRESKGA